MSKQGKKFAVFLKLYTMRPYFLSPHQNLFPVGCSWSFFKLASGAGGGSGIAIDLIRVGEPLYWGLSHVYEMLQPFIPIPNAS